MTEADLMLPQDKANHVLAGTLAFVVILFCARSSDWAMLGTLAVGLAKEVSDWLLNRRQTAAGATPTHDPSPFDFMATGIGGLLPCLAVLAS